MTLRRFPHPLQKKPLRRSLLTGPRLFKHRLLRRQSLNLYQHQLPEQRQQPQPTLYPPSLSPLLTRPLRRSYPQFHTLPQLPPLAHVSSNNNHSPSSSISNSRQRHAAYSTVLVVPLMPHPPPCQTMTLTLQQ